MVTFVRVFTTKGRVIHRALQIGSVFVGLLGEERNGKGPRQAIRNESHSLIDQVENLFFIFFRNECST